MKKIGKGKLFLIVLLTLFVGLVAFVIIDSDVPFKSSDINKYFKNEPKIAERIYGKYQENLMIFPDKISENAVVNEYYAEDYKTLDGIVAYLDITYSSEEYIAEIERLKNTSDISSYFEVEYTVNTFYDENCRYINTPAYIACYCTPFATYEYACLEEAENRVVYVWLRGITPEKLKINEKYMPKNYRDEFNDLIIGKDFSIYDYPNDDM